MLRTAMYTNHSDSLVILPADLAVSKVSPSLVPRIVRLLTPVGEYGYV